VYSYYEFLFSLYLWLPSKKERKKERYQLWHVKQKFENPTSITQTVDE